jgi:sugar O-acyltransferase (sialic acid O-acetyltransferase NeuD family)
MKSEKIVIIGAGNLAREVMDILESCIAAGEKMDPLGYVVDSAYGSAGEMVNGMPILGDFGWLAKHATEVRAVCGVGAPKDRHSLIARAEKLGVAYCNLIHPSVVSTRWVKMGKGVIIAAGCVLSNQICLGDHVLVNFNSTVGHDTVLEDFVTVAPGANLSGRVTISAGCYIGTGASVIEKIHLGEWSVVGAGSAVFADVPPNSTVIGVPARVMLTQKAGWHLGKSG